MGSLTCESAACRLHGLVGIRPAGKGKYMAEYYGHCHVCDYVLVNTFVTRPKIIYDIAKQELTDQMEAHFLSNHPEKKHTYGKYITVDMFNPIPKLEKSRILAKLK